MNRYGLGCSLRRVLSAVALAFSVSLVARRPSGYGSITGTMTDSSGAVVSGAKVTLTNEATVPSLSTTTGGGGVYKFSPVRIGNYKIDVTVSGFKTVAESHIVVDVSAAFWRTSHCSRAP